MGLGILSVAAIPFVDASRLAPNVVAEGRSYDYTLELASAEGIIGRVDVVVAAGTVVEVGARSCLSGADCLAIAAPFVPYERLVDEVAGRGWVTSGSTPLIEARSEDPDAGVRVVRVVDFHEG
jgi:hypothetical protein